MGIFDRIKSAVLGAAREGPTKSIESIKTSSEAIVTKPQVPSAEPLITDNKQGLIKRVGLSPRATLLFITDSEPQAHAPGMSVTISFDSNSDKAFISDNPVDDPATQVSPVQSPPAGQKEIPRTNPAEGVQCREARACSRAIKPRNW